MFVKMSFLKKTARTFRTDFASKAEKEEEDCGWLGKLGAALAIAGGASAESASKAPGGQLATPRAPGVNGIQLQPAFKQLQPAFKSEAFQNHTSDFGFAEEDSGEMKSSSFDREAYSMFDEETQNLLQRTQFPPPLKPLGMGISNFVYEVPKIHPMHAELTEELDLPESSKVAIKVTHDYSKYDSKYSAKHISKTIDLKTWGRERGVIPKEERLTGGLRRSFFPVTENEEQKEKLSKLWTRMSNDMVASPLSAPDDRGDFMPTFLPPRYNYNWRAGFGAKRFPMTAVEVFTPIGAVAKQFNTLVEEMTGSKDGSFMKRVRKSELWSAVFRKLIEDEWHKYMFDVIDELDIIPDDNHAMNFGLRLRDGWKERAQQFMTSYQDAFDTTDCASFTTIESEDEYNDLKHKFKPFKDGLLNTILEENVQQYKYGPLVAIDVDHFNKNDGRFETHLGMVEEEVKRKGKFFPKERMKEMTLNVIIGKELRPWMYQI